MATYKECVKAVKSGIDPDSDLCKSILLFMKHGKGGEQLTPSNTLDTRQKYIVEEAIDILDDDTIFEGYASEVLLNGIKKLEELL